MSLDLILSLTFSILSLVSVLIIVFLKKEGIVKFKKYLIASSCVFFSGTVFILLISIFKGPIPVVFILISELLITFVFAMSIFTMLRIYSQILEIRKELDEKKNKDIN